MDGALPLGTSRGYRAGGGPSGLGFGEVFGRTRARLDMGAPADMDAIFEEAAALYQVPVRLLKAIGKAESGFDAHAVSGAGAQGVMQLMPATAASLGVTDPFDARSNIMGGARYISDMLKRYDGNIDLALAAYNAGSGNVAKYGGVPPFKETRAYIKRVKEYMGEELHAGQSAGSYSPGAGSGRVREREGGFGLSNEQALYLAALMRLQIQDKMAAAGRSLLDNADSQGLL